MTPTQRSLKILRERGWTVWRVEHWNAFAKIRQDLFGFGDILAINKDTVLIVQTTSGSNVSARMKKIQENPIAKLWLSPTRWIHVHGWKGRKLRELHATSGVADSPDQFPV